MDFTKGNGLPILFLLLLLGYQGYYATTSSCPIGDKHLCWGPPGVNFLGLTVNQEFVKEQFFWFGFSLIIGAATGGIATAMHKHHASAWGVRMFVFTYLLVSIFNLFIHSTRVY